MIKAIFKYLLLINLINNYNSLLRVLKFFNRSFINNISNHKLLPNISNIKNVQDIALFEVVIKKYDKLVDIINTMRNLCINNNNYQYKLFFSNNKSLIKELYISFKKINEYIKNNNLINFELELGFLNHVINKIILKLKNLNDKKINDLLKDVDLY